MKNKKFNLSNALFSKVRQNILALLYGKPNSDFYTNEIIRLTKSGTGAVQRELENLVASGILVVKHIGNQKRYQANLSSPIFSELCGIVLKTFGLADVLKEALEPIEKNINIAFIYGSIAKQEDTANSDIDLMLISHELTYADIFNLLEKAESQLQRKINPTLYSPTNWIQKCRQENNFVTQVIKQPKIFLLGTENELANLR